MLEIIVVLIIVGILATLGMPQYGRTVERSRQAEAISILGALRGAQLRFAAENTGLCTAAIGDLDIDVPAGRYFTYNVLSAACDINDGVTTSEMARAVRNGIQQTAGSTSPAYELIIQENGTFDCAVGDCAGGP